MSAEAGFRSKFRPQPVGAAAGIVFDQLLGEPPTSLHPVVYFGRVMQRFERQNYRDERPSGVLHALVGAALGTGAGVALRSSALATGLAVGGRSLQRTAHSVAAALGAGDLESARLVMPSLVGRDPSTLDEAEMVRATIESVAENTVDAIIAPALFGAVLGAPGAGLYRAINTMDAMVGHKSEKYLNYGWASAKTDDLANWIPARCGSSLVALVRPSAAKEIRTATKIQAPLHPSPNSGVIEAAFAAALGIRLGGRNDYAGRIEERPVLGSGRAPEVRDIEAAIRLSRDVSMALVLLLALAGASWWWLAS